MKKGKLFVAEGQPENKMGQYTGEFRCPKKGEYFISGAIPMAYYSPNDLSCEYHIATLVTVRRVETVEVIV